MGKQKRSRKEKIEKVHRTSGLGSLFEKVDGDINVAFKEAVEEDTLMEKTSCVQIEVKLSPLTMDRVSKTLFPMSYASFLLVYFCYFLLTQTSDEFEYTYEC